MDASQYGQTPRSRYAGLTYRELHHALGPAVQAELTALLDGLGPDAPGVRLAAAALLRARTFGHPLETLPLLVHGVETGDPEPAVPLAAVHLLWWTSACHFDDLADAGAAPTGTAPGREAGAPGPEAALLAAVLCGTVLPLRILQSSPLDPAVREALSAELVRGAVSGAEGQLADLHPDPAGAERGTVLATYRGKSGGPFGMITAMAARLAGADAPRTALWREFGEVFGLLWQLFNDQQDLLTGRNEDLANGTVTYLLAGALEDAATPVRQRLLTLAAAARTPALATPAAVRAACAARAELAAHLQHAAVLDRFHADLRALRAHADRVLTRLGGDEDHLPALRALTALASAPLLRPATVPAA
ncbi:polyprenyl synthetase family protein [Streptomyces sp. NPDC097619]|uniref:polyprenyl synthetase family protein n=1 Tax=Streptomyces sp. NPDC097619 TaxID=3157228 RepID=UPI003323B378